MGTAPGVGAHVGVFAEWLGYDSYWFCKSTWAVRLDSGHAFASWAVQT